MVKSSLKKNKIAKNKSAASSKTNENLKISKKKQPKRKSKIQNKKINKSTKDKNLKSAFDKFLKENKSEIIRTMNEFKSNFKEGLLPKPNNEALILNCDSINNKPAVKANNIILRNMLNPTGSKSIDKLRKKSKKIYLANWQYYDQNKVTINPSPDGWYDYDAADSDRIEDAWQRLLFFMNQLSNVRLVESPQRQFIVDVVNWKQKDIYGSRPQTNIRRKDEKGKITNNPYLNKSNNDESQN